ncbi:MAG TPA: DUF2200 domain-containing protein [Flavisolibacter sp.]|nr:DUF2200 domain-containing protein [Flavisolibacter sp.]
MARDEEEEREDVNNRAGHGLAAAPKPVGCSGSRPFPTARAINRVQAAGFNKKQPPHMNTRVFKMSFAGVYPHYVQKAEKKGRTKEELDTIICWLTGYDQEGLQEQIDRKNDFETFFAQAPQINPAASKITGMICGYRVEEIEDGLMQKIRYLDKLVDELAKGRPMEKILRK